ncbi:non-homologous end joining protein Ku [Sphaerisporangium siamense]|uniref:Non-homologous end joining protein Ku n=1 Tax=Sphaerisporangium siamense TaxID=795645 RepID=A0A7W7GBI4_9ACTN|nr:Ku protein [Sphaerisporangium siamense]MBB4701021.1 DNA end-binding protein Ku [Sphaerisporangium siamense]GII85834.1 non-homologous end joining protein Ku [Sphaerisporangium siamense]
MRSIWKGAISFGLVTIPVKLYSATEQKDVTFHQVHREDAGRIKYRRVCAIDGQEVTYSDIAKGYELPGGEMVVLTDEDFAELPLGTSRRIDVLQFTPAAQIDPILFNKSYYLEPENTGVKPYVLLRDALERTGQVAIVKIALRQRESLATLRIRDGVFVLETMLWPDEVREPGFEFQDEDVEVRPQELRMAESLIETMAGDFDPSEYRDEYREALQQVIEAKVAGKELVRPEAAEEAGPAVDLMAALRASVDAAKREREGAREKAPARGKKAAGGEERAEKAGEAGEKAEKDGKKQPAKRRTRKTA